MQTQGHWPSDPSPTFYLKNQTKLKSEGMPEEIWYLIFL